MEKQHYKMYKDGKKWVFAAGTVIALGVGLSESTYVVISKYWLCQQESYCTCHIN
ncbi:cell surface hydrolase [Lactobacillus amylovorus CAG:719]|nr:cell surface hydrolase [Lactobacillus amylovorus CAG:719]